MNNNGVDEKSIEDVARKPAMSNEDAYRNLDRVNTFITNADTKTSFVLAFVGVIVLVFFTSGMIDEGFQSLSAVVSKLTWSDLKASLAIATIITLLGFVFFLARGVWKLIAALTATIDLDKFTDSNMVRTSNLFFGSIASRSFDDFIKSLNDMSENSLSMDIHSQTYINASICHTKFRNYNEGLKNIKYALVAFIVVVILLIIVRAVHPVT